MTKNDRISDISKSTGLSEDVIRRVLKAARESLMDSLLCGERATLPGICSFTVDIREKQKYSKLEGFKDEIEQYAKLKVTPSSSFNADFESKFHADRIKQYNVEQYKKDENSNVEYIRVSQISALQ